MGPGLPANAAREDNDASVCSSAQANSFYPIKISTKRKLCWQLRRSLRHYFRALSLVLTNKNTEDDMIAINRDKDPKEMQLVE